MLIENVTPDQLGTSNVTVNSQALAAGPGGTDLGSVLGDLAAGNDELLEIVVNPGIDEGGGADTSDGDPDTLTADGDAGENSPADSDYANDLNADGDTDNVPVSSVEGDTSSNLEGGASDNNLKDEENGEPSVDRGDDGARQQRPGIAKPDGGEPAEGDSGADALPTHSVLHRLEVAQRKMKL